MKKTFLFILSLLIFFIYSSSASALFNSSHTMKGTLAEETEAYFIGRTTINGSFRGQPLEHLADSILLQQMNGFPFIGASRISNLHTVIVAEDIDISTITSLEDFIVHYYDHITSYSDVDIVTEDGLFLLGIKEGIINISVELPYAVTTTVPLEIVPNNISRFFVIATKSPLRMQCFGNFSILTTLSDSSSVTLRDQAGGTLWSGGSPNDYLIIQDSSFSLNKSPPLSLLPLVDTTMTHSVSVSIIPAAPEDIQIQKLIENVSTILQTFNGGTSTNFLQSIHELDTLIETSSFIANGAMVLQQTSDMLTIDHSLQHFSSTGFVRFSTLDITNFGSSVGLSIKGDCSLCYLGDHFYNPAAKRSNNGISFPFELVFLWVLCLGVFIYNRFFLRPPVDVHLDNRVKRYGFFIHISALIIAFILLDLDVSILFGISALSSLVTQGFTASTGVFFLLEIIIWIFGFLILAVPLQLLSYSILRYLGIGKGGNGIWKAVGDVSIWVFSEFYLLLFFNILLSFIDFNSLIAMG